MTKSHWAGWSTRVVGTFPITCLPVHRTWVQSLIWKNPTCHRQLSPCAATTEATHSSTSTTQLEGPCAAMEDPAWCNSTPQPLPHPKSWSSLTPVSHSRPESGCASHGGHSPLGVAGPGLDLGRTEQHLVSQGAFLGTSFGGPMVKIPSSQCTGGLGLIPGQGTKSHLPQLKILHAAVKTWRSQINK